MEKFLNIKEAIGSDYAASSDKAEIIAKLIRTSLNNNEKIVISFKDINVVLTAFLNIAIGDLYRDYTKEKIESSISFIDCNENIKRSIELTKETAEKFYRNKKNGNL